MHGEHRLRYCGINIVTPEDVIRKAVETGEEVKYPVNLWSVNQVRKQLAEAALKLTPDPIIITTRTDGFNPFFLVRKYDKEKESVMYEDVAKEAREKGWIK
jgi:hypothetical protein